MQRVSLVSFLLLFSFLPLLYVKQSSAVPIIVSALNGSDHGDIPPFRSISRAVDYAQNDIGESAPIIFVEEGVYVQYGTIYIPRRNFRSFHIFGNGSVIIECSSNSLFLVYFIQEFVMDGLSISNGLVNGDGGALSLVGVERVLISNSSFSSSSAFRNGGAVYISGSMDGLISFKECTFSSNLAGNSGEAIMIEESTSSIEIRDCFFNKSGGNGEFGGAIALSNVSNASYIRFIGTRFIDVWADVSGGAISMYKCTNISLLEITDCHFEEFYALDGGGGALAIWISSLHRFVIKDSTFGPTSFQAASSDGGAIFLLSVSIGQDLLDADTLQITNTSFINISGGGRGGAFAVAESSVSGLMNITDCLFSRTAANSQGGAIWLSNFSGDLLLDRVEFVSTVAGKSGGGIHLEQFSGDLTLQSSSFIGTQAQNGEAGGLYVLESALRQISIRDCSFVDSSAFIGSGGAFRIDSTSQVLGLHVHNSSFVDCSTNRDGGAIMTQGILRINISDSSFVRNWADAGSSWGFGGAMFLEDSVQVLIDGCHFTNNTASNDGGCLSVIGVPPNASLMISDTTFNRCSSTTNDRSPDGGAVFMQSFSTSHLSGCHFLNNLAKGSGGGILAFDVVNFTVIDSTFFSNKASQSAAAIFSSGTGVHFIVHNCSFLHNEAKWKGGAIARQEAQEGFIFDFVDCTFWGSSSQYNEGGAVALQSIEKVSFIRCTFLESQSGKHGGALYLSLPTVVEMLDCTFQSNSNRGNFNGGAIWIRGVTRFKLEKILARNNTSGFRGGFASIEDTDFISFKELVISDNIASDSGGGIWMRVLATFPFDDSNITFEDCEISHNYANRHGGGLQLENDAVISSSLHVSFYSSTITNNSCGGEGGGLKCEGGLLMEKTRVKGNIAQGAGGGVYLGGDADRMLFAMDFVDCTFENNTSTSQRGGALYISHWNGPSPHPTPAIFADTQFIFNSAYLSGGGIYIQNSVATFNRVLVMASTGQFGGGLALYNVDIHMTDSNITENSARNLQGGAIFCASNSRVDMIRTSIYNNSMPDITCSSCILNPDLCNQACSRRDQCSVCSGNNTCLSGCDMMPWSNATNDICNKCQGDNTSCVSGCDNQPWSNASFDVCNVCGGNGTSCLSGCDNKPWSNATIDACGVCDGDGTSCLPHSSEVPTSTPVPTSSFWNLLTDSSTLSSDSRSFQDSTQGERGSSDVGNYRLYVVALLCLILVLVVGFISGALILLWKRKKSSSSFGGEVELEALQIPSSQEGTAHNSSDDEYKTEYHQLPSRHKWELMQLESEIEYSELEFEENLGKGEFGAVVKATWRKAPVAVKKTKEDLSESQLKELKAEAKIHKNIPTHDNVLQFLGITLCPEMCIVVEYVAGGCLENHLETNGRLNELEEMRVIKGIASGLNHLHSVDVLHRDLAARNVLLTLNMMPKVSDFGMSRSVGRNQEYVTSSDRLPLKWLAPESIRDRVFTKMTDVWSFGVLLFEVITCEEPYSDLSSFEAAQKVAFGGLRLELPQEEKLKSLMEMCLKEPETRPTFRKILRILE